MIKKERKFRKKFIQIKQMMEKKNQKEKKEEKNIRTVMKLIWLF